MKKKKHRVVFLVILILLFGFFSAQNLYKKHNNYEDLPDLLVFESSFYNTLKGDFLYNFRGGDVCHLGIHFAPMLLIYIPFYALYQNVYTLFLVQGLLVAIGALGIYFLAGRLLKNDEAAFLLSCAFLMNPVVLGGQLWSIHEEPLAVPFLTFALYAWVKRRWTVFWLLMAGALLCKETIALMTAFLGVALAVRYRRFPETRLHAVLLFVISVSWFLISTKLLMPLFSPLSLSDLQMSARYDNKIGHSLSEIFLNFFRNPMIFLKTIFQRPKLIYLFNLFLPFAFICFFSPALLLPVLPVILMNLLSVKYKWHATLLHQYTIPAAPVIFFATMDGMRRMRTWYYYRSRKSAHKIMFQNKKHFLIAFCILVFIAGVLGCFTSGLPEWIFYNRDPRISYLPLSSTSQSRNAAKEALALIPPDADVSSSHLLANHLAKRKIIYYNSDYEIPGLPIEYYVIIKTGPKGDQPEEFSEKTIQYLRDHYNAIFQKDRIIILKSKKPPVSLEEFRKNRRGKKLPGAY